MSQLPLFDRPYGLARKWDELSMWQGDENLDAGVKVEFCQLMLNDDFRAEDDWSEDAERMLVDAVEKELEKQRGIYDRRRDL